MIEFKPLNSLSQYLEKLIKGRLWLKVMIGLTLGVILGLILNPSFGYLNTATSKNIANWLDLPGQIFMRLVQMIMIPLVFTSIILGLVSNSKENLKTLGLRLLIYFLFTTAIAIFIGITLALLFEPGKYVFIHGGLLNNSAEAITVSQGTQMIDNLPLAISNLIPSNPLEAILYGEMFGIVIFTIIIGVAIAQLNKATVEPIIRLSESVQKICMIIVSWAMVIVPYAVFGLVAALVSKTGLEVFLGLAYYISVVVAGLILLLLFYLAIVYLVARKGPLTFLKSIKDVQLLAFSTASSAAVMPLSMKTADEKLGVSSSISDLVIPIGATINMDGTALFQCVTTIFLAQAYGIDLSIMNLILITTTVVAASIGTPAIPGGGVLVLSSVLQSSGIPVEGLIIIIGIDRILGMFRTTANVTGDLTASVVFNRYFGEKKKNTIQ